jgi:chloramphenicol-sensitive protein RarD
MQQKAGQGVVDTVAPAHGEAGRGFLFALAAYIMWGFLPLYMKAVDHIAPVEVVAYRVLWSLPVAALVLLALGRLDDIKAAFRQPRTLLMAAMTAAIISVNWGVYVWAISVGRTVETAMGYYINPLVTVLLGAVLLGERLNRYQQVSIGLMVIAVVLLTVQAGGLPWVSLVLALTFAAYGYLRKTLPVGPSQGLLLEVLILAGPCLAYLLWLGYNGQGTMLTGGIYDFGMLALAGPITAVPLILYASGAKLLRISTIGIMQYIGPTMIMLIAVLVFGEPFGTDRMLAFALIWAALALYTWSIFYAREKPTDDQ